MMTQEEFFKRYTYNIRTDRIGGGGFGTVYKATDNLAHRIVAIKVSEVKTAANGKVFSLKDEFNALKGLPMHPNIANYEDFFTFDTPQGVFDYAVMQYYPDGNLTNIISKSLPIEQKEDIALQLLNGIGFLHEHKVVHRDLKPGNILVVKHTNRIIPIITDFGLSKTADTNDRSMFSNSFGGGTARYSSPEQLQGKPLRVNTDLWSYGTVVYELFTGNPLFKSGSSAANTAQADLEIYNKIIHGDLGGNLANIPDKWRKVLERCLVVNPENRARSAEELKKMLNKDVAVTDKTELSNEEEKNVEEDRTFIEDPEPPKEKPATPQASELVLSAPKGKPKSKETLPWIIGGSAAVVILAVVLGVVLGHNPKPKVVDNVPHDSAIEALAQTYTVNGISFTMKYVEGGTFTMGATSEQGKDIVKTEKPAHSVTVNDFCIGETVVTQALWEAVMGNNSNPSRFRGDNLPVEQVSWNDCQEFICKLDQLTGKNFRLPTEAEWEYAARGGIRSKGFKYAGSDTVGNVAWYRKNDNRTHSVMTKSPNELGIYDMSGNVWEWCSDCYRNYSKSPQTNPEGSADGSLRMVRGGSWLHDAHCCRVSGRYFKHPDHSGDDTQGFRLALSK